MSTPEMSTSATRQSTCKARHAWLERKFGTHVARTFRGLAEAPIGGNSRALISLTVSNARRLGAPPATASRYWDLRLLRTFKFADRGEHRSGAECHWWQTLAAGGDGRARFVPRSHSRNEDCPGCSSPVWLQANRKCAGRPLGDKTFDVNQADMASLRFHGTTGKGSVTVERMRAEGKPDGSSPVCMLFRKNEGQAVLAPLAEGFLRAYQSIQRTLYRSENVVSCIL